MTHIEQLHLEAIQKDKEIRKYLCENDFGTSKLEIIVAKKSAKTTKNIAIEFAQWIKTYCIVDWDETDTPFYRVVYRVGSNFFYTEKELFQEYLKTKENEAKIHLVK
jgi:hypothetical protein